MAKKKTIKDSISEEAINIVDTERRTWETAIFYITDRVGFRMRDMIRTLRKNYWGVFDEPIDPTTGREKTWVHLAMSIVEDINKNIDIDQKDIDFRARKPAGYPFTHLTRQVVKDYLSRMSFGEVLDTDQRQVLIDGTTVWKTWESKEDGKPVMNRRTVDLLQCYIDPTSESIQKAYRFTERALMLPEEIAGMTGWMNTEGITGSTNLDPNNPDNTSGRATPSTGSYVDVWECWGKIPMWMVSGDKKDTEEIDGHIVVSGLQSGTARLHLVERNENEDSFGNIIKPYEEWRPVVIRGRWYGLGVIERILSLQEYLNATVNIRQNRAFVSQLGLFKIRRGSGITPSMLSKLSANGAIPVNQMDDIQQMPVQEVGPTSYKDEEVIRNWAQMVTSAYPIASGEILPASSTATSAAIANTNAKTAYTLFKESTGSFIERWMTNHALKIIAKTVGAGEIIRFTNDDEQYRQIVDRVIAVQAEDLLEKFYEKGIVPTEQEVEDAMQMVRAKMYKEPQLFIELAQDIIAEGLDTKVKITNEDMDVAVTISNLIQLLPAVPEAREVITKQVFDLMGLDVPNFPKINPALPQGQSPTQIPQNLTDLVGQSNGVNG